MAWDSDDRVGWRKRYGLLPAIDGHWMRVEVVLRQPEACQVCEAYMTG